MFIYFEDNAGVIVNPKGEMKGAETDVLRACSGLVLIVSCLPEKCAAEIFCT